MEPIRITSAEAIRTAAFELLTANPGIPLTQIADRAGVGAATLHRHFASRRDLVLTLAEEGIALLAEAIDRIEASAPSAAGRLDALFGELVPLGARFGFLARCPFDDEEIDGRYEAEARRLYGLMADLAAVGLVSPDLGPERAGAFLEWVLWGLAEDVTRGTLSERDAIRLGRRLFLGGVGARR